MDHEYTIAFRMNRADTMDVPGQLLKEGRYLVGVDTDGSVSVQGNRDGLLFLAEVLTRCAIGQYNRGFHIHLSLDSREDGPNTNLMPELTFFAAEDA